MLPVFVTDRFAQLVLTATYVIWLAPELYRTITRRGGGSAWRTDRFSGSLLSVSMWIGIAGGYYAAYAAPQLAIAWGHTVLFWAGILIMLGGVAFRWYSIHVLGRYFSVVIFIQPEQRIVQSGPYRTIRHPSYTGALLTVFGLGLVLGNWLSLLVLLSCVAAGYGYRIHVEEQVLLAAFGDAYRQYQKHTKRIIPFVI